MTTTTTIAKITNRRPRPNMTDIDRKTYGSHMCEVTCGICGDTRTVSYGGWSALACICGATIERYSGGLEDERKIKDLMHSHPYATENAARQFVTLYRLPLIEQTARARASANAELGPHCRLGSGY